MKNKKEKIVIVILSIVSLLVSFLRFDFQYRYMVLSLILLMTMLVFVIKKMSFKSILFSLGVIVQISSFVIVYSMRQMDIVRQKANKIELDKRNNPSVEEQEDELMKMMED